MFEKNDKNFIKWQLSFKDTKSCYYLLIDLKIKYLINIRTINS